MTVWLKVETHCHTAVSGDSLNDLPVLLKTARARGLDRLVITDHNSIRGALKAKEMAPELVIVGEEVKTDCGEFLAFFVTEEVPKGLPYREALGRLRDQGAFVSVSHPYDLRRAGWLEPVLAEIAPLVDAIEVFNSRCYEPVFNDQARAFAEKHDLAGTAGSDAHIPWEVGRSTMRVPEFASAEELRRVIREAVLDTRMTGTYIHLASAYARLHKAIWPYREFPNTKDTKDAKE